MHKNFGKYLEKINKVIKDFQDWKNKLDKKFDIYIQFLNNLYNLEKYYFDDALNKFDEQKNNFNKDIFYDYESLKDNRHKRNL